MNSEKFQQPTGENPSTEWDNLDEKAVNNNEIDRADLAEKIKNSPKAKKIFMAIALGAAITAGVAGGIKGAKIAEQKQQERIVSEYAEEFPGMEEDETWKEQITETAKTKDGMKELQSIIENKIKPHDTININFIDISLSSHAQYQELIKTVNTIKPKNLITVHGNGIKFYNQIHDKNFRY